VIYIKQHTSSSLSAVEIKNYVHDLGYQRFSENETLTGSGPIRPMNKVWFSLATLINSTSEVILLYFSYDFWSGNRSPWVQQPRSISTTGNYTLYSCKRGKDMLT
jgi:hypothetical protein